MYRCYYKTDTLMTSMEYESIQTQCMEQFIVQNIEMTHKESVH